jgi:hypothetical protein
MTFTTRPLLPKIKTASDTHRTGSCVSHILSGRCTAPIGNRAPIPRSSDKSLYTDSFPGLDTIAQLQCRYPNQSVSDNLHECRTTYMMQTFFGLKICKISLLGGKNPSTRRWRHVQAGRQASSKSRSRCMQAAGGATQPPDNRRATSITPSYKH